MTEKINISQIEVKELYNETGGATIDYVGVGGVIASDVIYVGGYSHITGYVYSDQASAVDGVVIEQCQRSDLFTGTSPIDWAATTTKVTSSSMTYTAADIISNALSVQVVAPFARIVYVNGAITQTIFNIYFCARIIRGL